MIITPLIKMYVAVLEQIVLCVRVCKCMRACMHVRVRERVCMRVRVCVYGCAYKGACECVCVHFNM